MRRRGLLRLLLLAYPRRFRAQFGADLRTLCRELDARAYACRPGRMAWDLLRGGLGARIDDFKMRWSGLAPRPGGLIPRGDSTAMDSLFQDLGYAVRTLAKNPGFTAVAVLSLALGIGANTAVFGIVDAALLRELPVTDPGSLVVLQWMSGPDGSPDISINGWLMSNELGRRESSSFSYPQFERFSEAAAGRAEMFGFADLHDVSMRVAADAELAGGQVVTGNYYRVLGVAPAAGRLIGPGDDRPGAEPVAVLSYGFWQRRFGGDPDLVGSVIHVNGVPFTVLGVSARGFAGALQVGSSPDVSIPVSTQARVMRQGDLLGRGDFWWFHVMGRREQGIGGEALRARLEPVLKASVREDVAGTPETQVPDLMVLDGSQGLREARGLLVEPVMTLAWVVALILLIACANLANLLLARSSAREREIAVRQSLGASRSRLVRQLLTESILLALVGGGVGLLLASWGQGLVVSLGALDADLSLDVGLDPRLMAFAFAVALLTGVLFGIAPALRATGRDLTPALRESGGSSTGSPRSLLVSKAILATQVGLSVVLLVMAGMFVRSLSNLSGSIHGFDPGRVLLFSVNPTLNHYENPEARQLYHDALARFRAMPSVEAASVAGLTPLGGRIATRSMNVAGYEPEEGESVGGLINRVGAGYIEALRVPLVAGRGLEQADIDGARPVVVVNEELVRRYFAGRDPIGGHVGWGSDGPAELEIVGVVADIPYQQARNDMWPTVYAPYTRAESLGRMTFVLRTRAAPSGVLPTVRETMRTLDPYLPLIDVVTQEQQSYASLARERQLARLSGMMGGLAMLLSCVGLYGILSYAVVRRTREIGVRKALGADRRALWRLVLRELRPVALGAVIGVAGALFVSRLIASQLYELSAVDPVSVVGATAVLVAVALTASWVPARRAAAIDPVDALRQE